MKKSYFLYAALALGSCVMAILMARVNLLVFVDIPSIALIILLPIFLLLAVFGPKGIVNSFRIAMESADAPVSELKKAIVFFSTVQKVVLFDGVLFTLMGIILILYGISKGDDSPVALYVVIASMTFFYSILIVLIVAIPFRAALEKKLAALE